MSDWIDQALAYLRSRTPRERWGAVLACCILGTLIINAWIVGPLSSQAQTYASRAEQLDASLLHATLRAAEIRTLRAGIAEIDAKIKPGESTTLFSLLEGLAEKTRVKDQLESIKPKAATGNETYPETRVEVQLKGTTLDRMVEFIYEIENGPMHLIVKSIRVKRRGEKSPLLDVTFSVSIFERA